MTKFLVHDFLREEILSATLPKNKIAYARRLAFSIIKNVISENQFSHYLLDLEFSKHRVQNDDKALITELVYGALRYQKTLNYIIDSHLKEKKIKISGSVKIVLQMALFQLLFLDRIPEYSLVNDAVEQIKIITKGSLTSWANAALRKAVKEKLTLRKEIVSLQRSQSIEDLAIGYSYKLSLAAYLQNRYHLSITELQQALAFGNERSELSLRVNTLKISAENFFDRYQSISLHRSLHSPVGVRVGERIGLTNFEGFITGECSVQDEASQLVGYLTNPQEGDNILDACSAPGGKASHIQEIRKNKGSIICFDKNPKRIEMGKENFERLAIKNATWVAKDILEIENTEHYHEYDMVIVDAPCSAVGIFHRHPELKYMALSQRLEICVPMQKKILEKMARCVKKNGVLMYSICSTVPEEGEKQIKDFLISHPEFVVDMNPSQPEMLKPFLADGFFQTIAYQHKMDGFFAARLYKKGSSEDYQ